MHRFKLCANGSGVLRPSVSYGFPVESLSVVLVCYSSRQYAVFANECYSLLDSLCNTVTDDPNSFTDVNDSRCGRRPGYTAFVEVLLEVMLTCMDSFSIYP